MSRQRTWFIAVAPTGGMHAGNPPPLDVDTTIYGPYTKAQAEEAEKVGEGFPDETHTVVIFTPDDRPPFRTLMKNLRRHVAEEQEEQTRERDENESED